MRHCIYCPAILSEREEWLYGDRCADHALQFDNTGTEVTVRRPLHDELVEDDGDYSFDDEKYEELDFN